MGPFIRIKNSTTKMMYNVVIALVPIIFFSFYKNGVIPYMNGTTNIFGMIYPIIFIFISTMSTLFFETMYQLIFNKDKKKIKNILFDSYAYMPGLFLGLILPINTPISVLIVGAFAASIIGKMIFGGFGQNIFNPALIGRIFIISTYALAITSNGGYLNSYEVDTISGATPLSNLATITGIGTYETVVAPYGSLLNFFIGTIPGAVGETSALLCIIAFIFLTYTKTIKWRIPLCYVSTVFVMTLIIGLYFNLGIWYPLFQIFSGGLMFGAVFMATDPVTSPITKNGQVLYGVLLGLLTVTFRFLTPYPEGVLTSILTMNMLVFIIDKIGMKAKFNYKKMFIPIIVILLFCATSVYASIKKLDVDTSVKDPNYEIINIENKNSEVIYTVTEQGYSSKIKLEITFKNDRITRAKVVDQNDSFFSKVEDVSYLDKLIKKQDVINDCDTVSGATISSTAVKKAFVNTIEDYKNGGYKNFDSSNVKEEKANGDFTINSKEEVAGKTVYNVSEKSFGGTMELTITINNDKVESIVIGNHTDTLIGSLITDSYLNSVINGQDSIDSVDVVSTATISSNAIKNAVKNTLADYRGEQNEG